MRKRGRPLPVKSAFVPKNPDKYVGAKSRKPGGEFGLIVARSGWERQVMKFLDENINVLAWNSEGFSVDYRSPLDGRLHKYYPDFVIKARQTDGSVKTVVVEIKPAKQAKSNPKTLKDRITRAVNEAKWAAARAWCEQRNISFLILTEDEINFAG